MTGKIGNITHKVTAQTLKDEIIFAIPVTNTSSVEQCYIIQLFDSHGAYVASHPLGRVDYIPTADKVMPGITEIMFIDSNWQDWSVMDVEGQTITFKLFADPTKWLGVCDVAVYGTGDYKVVDTKTYVVPTHKDEPGEAEELIDKLTVLVVAIVLAILVFKFS